MKRLEAWWYRPHSKDNVVEAVLKFWISCVAFILLVAVMFAPVLLMFAALLYFLVGGRCG
ncbi:MAG: hypothetical protein M0Z99_32240 [Betaproteobacteria bacterium]|nr:hypothetical protein [Betaproteobacteria bacterium]